MVTKGAPSLSILIADDAPVMRMLLKVMISRVLRADFTEAPDGATAMKLAQGKRFDLVFLDINMPHMTGLTVLDGLRRTEAYRERPIVLLTTLGQEKDRERGLALGASAYLLKPLRNMELIRVLLKLVPQAMGVTESKKASGAS
ncbi:MAG: response regulator [Myxococcota bacterium]